MKDVVGFLRYRVVAYIVSLIMFIIFVSFTVMNNGLLFGIDFVGGVKVIAKFEKDVNESKIRDSLAEYNPMVQQIGKEELNEYIISTKLQTGDNKVEKSLENVKKALSGKFNNIEFLSEENVGPAIGDFLKKSAIKLFLVALILMAIYLTFRFEFKYSVGALAALVHDIALSLLFCGFAGIEINIPVVAALLTIFGYSINDTIVIFDRIRENVVYMKTKQPLLDVINLSITQSISRTLLTSLTTLFAVLSLYLLGGKVLNDFALVLLFGIFVGTYSSVYIASPFVLSWEKYVVKK